MTVETRTTCPYCGVGCGVIARRRPAAADGRLEESVTISGDPRHPASFGRLCSKGSALAETLGLEGRLLHPSVHGERVSWDAALQFVADGILRTIREHGPDSVAFYVSGQLLTEDYYVANKLMKGFIGAANIDTNSRLCMASAVAGHKRAFGADVVPVCYEDLELADLIVLVGSNTAWCHPVLFQRIAQAKERRPGTRIVVVDPRRTPTCELADMHLPVRPGSDVWLFNGLLAFLHRNGFADPRFVSAHTTASDAAVRAAEESAGDLETVARACRVDAARLEAFYRLFAATARVVTAFSQGVNQSSSGTDKVNSIINCHLLTGRIGAPGMGPFSITGQPNAMGGREVGGMANMLAAHMSLEDAAHRQIVQEHWNSPRIASRAGLKAVELFDAIHDGRIRAVWIMATNPVVSLPDADRARAALERCPLVIVSDCVTGTDTNALAHVLLPAAAWGEKDGTVTNSERRISRQRAFLPAPGEARPDWWIVCDVARRMGFEHGFTYRSAHEIFDEHARLSARANNGSRAFDIGALAGLSAAAYDALEPLQWPLPAFTAHAANGATNGSGAHWPSGAQRLCSGGRFYHADGKARFVPTPPRAPVHATSEEYPLSLNTGRIRDQWHTMTRTGMAARLSAHLPEPFADLHPHDALLLGLQAGDLVRVSTRWGSLVVRLRTSGEIARGEVFVPIHWNGEFASDARVGALVNPVVDPLSGEPEFKHTPARIEPFHVLWHGFVLTRQEPDVADLTWWARARGEGFWRYEIAGRAKPADWSAWALALLGATEADADYLDYHDAAAGLYRSARLIGDRLEACVYVSARANLPSRTWISTFFAKERLDASDRIALLAGVPVEATADPGPVVCSCFSIGRETIRASIVRHGLVTARQVGERLRAGTNCGSCLPEIRTLLVESAGTQR